MHFSHSSEIWKNFPELVPGVLSVNGIGATVAVEARTADFLALADAATGEVGVLLGDREHGYRDPGLVTRVVEAVRQATEVEG